MLINSKAYFSITTVFYFILFVARTNVLAGNCISHDFLIKCQNFNGTTNLREEIESTTSYHYYRYQDVVYDVLFENSNFTVFPEIASNILNGIRSLTIVNSGIEILYDNENSETSPFSEAKRLESLDLSDNFIKEIAENTFNNNCNLQQIELNNNMITTLKKYAFRITYSPHNSDYYCRDSNNIEVDVNLSDNLIENIEALCFENEKIRSINLKNNRLRVIKTGMFHGAKSLNQLDLSNNQIEKIAENAFLDQSGLTEIFLDDNVLRTIEGETFNGLSSVVKLNLSSQQIENINSFSFRNMNRLENLFLANNRIRILKENAFTGAVSLKTLDLSNNSIEEMEGNCFQSVSLEKVNLKNNRLTLINNRTFVGTTSLHFLDLSNNSIELIEENAFKDQTQVTHIFLNNNRLKVVERNIFNGLNSVLILNLSNQLIEKFDLSFFRSMKGIQHLYLANNSITQIEDGMFCDYEFLKEVDLNNNEIQSLGERSFCSKTLEKINLRNNRLTVIKTTTFEGAFSLKFLDLSNNSIELIEENAFKDQTLLTNILLDNNRLKVVESYTFNGLKAVSNFDLSNDLIEKVANNSFQNMKGVTHIFLGNNSVTHIEDHTFCGLELLVEVILNNNAIDSMGSRCFCSVRLENVDLRNNRLKVINNKTFEGATALKFLRLSDNHIETIEPEAFISNTQLLQLDLRNNKLKTFKDSLVGYVAAHSNEIDLSCNPLEAVHFSNQHQIRLLNLSSDNIEHLDFDTFEGLDLEVLVLSGNKLETFDTHVLYPMGKLVTLYIDNNKLTEIDYEDPKFQMRNIDLTYNNWSCSYLKKMVKHFHEKNLQYIVKKKPNTVRNVAGIGCTEEIQNKVDDNSTKLTNINSETSISVNLSKIEYYLGNLTKWLENRDKLVDNAVLSAINNKSLQNSMDFSKIEQSLEKTLYSVSNISGNILSKIEYYLGNLTMWLQNRDKLVDNTGISASNNNILQNSMDFSKIEQSLEKISNNIVNSTYSQSGILRLLTIAFVIFIVFVLSAIAWKLIPWFKKRKIQNSNEIAENHSLFEIGDHKL